MGEDPGKFEGSWVRQQPGWKQFVMLRRAEKGEWAIRFYWQIQGGIEFDTAWNESSHYTYSGFEGSLTLRYDAAASSRDRLVFHYERKQSGAREAQLTERGDLTLSRIEKGGRALRWDQPLLVTDIVFGKPSTVEEEQPKHREEHREWTFIKLADRELYPDEIPW